MIASVFAPPAALNIGALFQNWHESARGTVPHRNSIDPLSMRALLPDIAIMEFIADRQDWRYALVGENVREMIGGAVKGRLLGEVLAESGDQERVGRFYRDTATWRYPTITFGEHTVGYATHEKFARLLFPYRGQDGSIDTLLLVLMRLDSSLP